MSANNAPINFAVIGGRIKKVYEDLKSKRIGKPYKVPSKVHSDMWVRAAQIATAHYATPEQFVEAAFTYCMDKDGPFPNALAGKVMEQWLSMYVASKTRETPTGDVSLNAQDAVTELEQDIAITMELMENHTGTNDLFSTAALEFLRARFTQLDPVIRCLLGYPDAEIMEKYYEEAKELLWNHPARIQAAKALELPVDNVLNWNPYAPQ